MSLTSSWSCHFTLVTQLLIISVLTSVVQPQITARATGSERLVSCDSCLQRMVLLLLDHVPVIAWLARLAVSGSNGGPSRNIVVFSAVDTRKENLIWSDPIFTTFKCKCLVVVQRFRNLKTVTFGSVT